MIKNETYNLALQLTQHLKSLWRIQERYRDDTSCAACQGLWDTMRQDLEEHVTALKGELKNHLEAE